MKNFLLFVTFIVILLLSALGAIVPETPSTRPVGPLQLGAFSNGLSLYQGYRGQFYSFSPFNDYFILPFGSRAALISSEEIKNKTYVSSVPASHLKNISQTIKSYIQKTTPGVSFIAATGKTIRYDSRARINTLSITRSVRFDNDTMQERVLGSTLTFRSSDFIFDPSGQLYNYQTDEDIISFGQIYKIALTRNPYDLRIAVPQNAVLIMNRAMAGVIVIKALPNQYLYVNRDTKLVEVEEMVKPINGSYKTELHIETYKTLEEAQKAL